MLNEINTKQKEIAKHIKNDISSEIRSSLLDTMLLMQQHEKEPLQEINNTSESVNSVSTMTAMESMIAMIKNLEKKVDKISRTVNTFRCIIYFL